MVEVGVVGDRAPGDLPGQPPEGVFKPLAGHPPHRLLLLAAGGTAAEHERLTAVGAREQLDLDVGLHLLPRRRQQVALEGFEPGPRGADQVVRPARPQRGQVLLADDPAVQHPDAVGLAVLGLDGLQDLVQRGDVRAVAIEHLVGQREAIRTDDQGQHDLGTIGPVIARVAPAHLGIGRGQALDVGTRQIVEEDLVLGPEQFPVARGQVLLEGPLVRQEPIQAAVEAVGVHARGRNAQQIIQRGARVPARFDGQLTAGRAQAVDGQDRRDPRPRHLGRLPIQCRFAKGRQAQALPQLPPQPDVPELSRPRPAHAVQADLHHAGFLSGRRRARREERQLTVVALGIEDAHRLAPPGLGRAVEVAEIADRPLAGARRGADRFHHRATGEA